VYREEYRRSCVKAWKLFCKLDICLNTLAMRLSFVMGAANLVAGNEDLAKVRRVYTPRPWYLCLCGKFFLRKLASCSGVFRSARDEGRSFFACTGRKEHMEELTSPFYDNDWPLWHSIASCISGYRIAIWSFPMAERDGRCIHIPVVLRRRQRW
jgi:hypothetical protein